MKNDKTQRNRIAVNDLKARNDVKGGVHLYSSGAQVSSSSGSKLTSSSGSKPSTNTTVS